MEDQRQRLINLVHGGTGRVAPWIEKATLRRPGQADADVYAVHLPAFRNDGEDLVIHATDGNLDLCHALLHTIATGAKPADPSKTQEELAADYNAWRASLPQPEDCGRVVADLADLDNKH